MPSGIIVIDKPEGWTSMDVCAKLRGIFHERRIGHAGTLDPMATGVLPVFVGRAARAVEFASESDKEYIAGIKLGIITNTQDTTGEMLEQRPVQIDRETLVEALAAFQGTISQIPPMYSAIKIDGKKLYELARKGREVERAPRDICIGALELLEETPPAGSDCLLRVICSKGTYVRTLCHDIGQSLGCGAAMSYLRRTQAAGFSIQEAITLEMVQNAPDPTSLLLPVDEYFARSGWSTRTIVSLEAEKRLRNGASVLRPGMSGYCRAYSQSGEFLGLANCEGGKMSLLKSFYEV